MNVSGRFLLPLLILFLAITIGIYFFSGTLNRYYIDHNLLFASNTIFFIVSIISFFIQRKGLRHKNPHVFVRTVMGAMMFKMVICIIAVLAYVYFSGESFNKRGVFIALFFYLVYLAAEVYLVMKLNKSGKKNG